MWATTPLPGRTVLDVGAGSAFHAARYAEQAAHVIALEPDRRLLSQAGARLRRNARPNLSLVAAGAEHIPFGDATVDIIHARFAYFFGTDACLPGMAEAKRVLKPGGYLFIVDTNPDQGRMGQLARQAYPRAFPPDYTERNRAFYSQHGFTAHRIDTWFETPNREILARVFRMDYPHCHEELLAQIDGTKLSYGIMLYVHRKKEQRCTEEGTLSAIVPRDA
jgi:ubiquinone/menaquinone biosynthesis C-methylase UbiE